MIPVGLGLRAAGAAAFAAGFVCYTWLTHDAGPAAPASRVEPHVFAVNNSTTVAKSQMRDHARASSANVEGEDGFGPAARSQSISASVFFGQHFASGLPDAFRQTSQGSLSFTHFRGEDSASERPLRSAATPPAAAPRAAARILVAAAAPKRATKAGYQLASASETGLALGYAPTDSATGSEVTGSLKDLATKDSDLLGDVDTSHTAIYDIRSHIVYLPNGRRLEAHSGLGSHMDNPRTVAMRNVGATPPNVYDLKLRERPFHGVRALRLIPKDDSKMHGRNGILAHSYMLGPNGQSNGCLSFSDYPAFLEAYLRGDVTRVVVVEHLAGAPSAKTASDWFSNTLKDIFRRS